MLKKYWRKLFPLHPTARICPASLSRALRLLRKRGYVVEKQTRVRWANWVWSRIYLRKGRGRVIVITEARTLPR